MRNEATQQRDHEQHTPADMHHFPTPTDVLVRATLSDRGEATIFKKSLDRFK
jgi:hypothetical protein